MSAHAPTAAPAAPHHISTRTYLMVFVWLAVMTAIEVAVAALPIVEIVQVVVLIALAIIKALLVVLFYMHLRHDSKWYWVTLIVPIGFVFLAARFLPIR